MSPGSGPFFPVIGGLTNCSVFLSPYVVTHHHDGLNTAKVLSSQHAINIVAFNVTYDPMRQFLLFTPFYR